MLLAPPLQQPFLSIPSSRNPGPLVDWWPPPFNKHPPPREPSINLWPVVLCLCLRSWISVLFCVVLFYKEGTVVMGVWLLRFYLNMSVAGDICLFWVGPWYVGVIGECCFGVMYCEWYGVCNFVVLSVVEVCADYNGVNVFHVCLNFGVVYGVVVSVNVCGTVCVIVCCLFLMSGCCLLWCSVVGGCGVVIFVLSVMCVVGGVPLWVECVFVSVVHPVAILGAVFCVFL